MAVPFAPGPWIHIVIIGNKFLEKTPYLLTDWWKLLTLEIRLGSTSTRLGAAATAAATIGS